jgi:tRNA pseudouridine55 synthase
MHHSVLLFDKPVGFSSFQIVRLLKKHYDKVGHAGTLDPFASGLLIILIGRATKQFENIQKLEKEYVGEIVLGITTDTYDITGTKTEPHNFVKENYDLTTLNSIAERFVGEIEQAPPRYSALKRRGRKLYQMSRKNVRIEITPRRVIVKSFRVTDIDLPILHFKSIVGRGVYIRSLAHDLGNAAGCGATLLSLRRTRIGEYDLAQAEKLGSLLS